MKSPYFLTSRKNFLATPQIISEKDAMKSTKLGAFLIFCAVAVILFLLFTGCAHRVQVIAPSTAQVAASVSDAQSHVTAAQKLNEGVGTNLNAAQTDADRIEAKGVVVLKYWGDAK